MDYLAPSPRAVGRAAEHLSRTAGARSGAPAAKPVERVAAYTSYIKLGSAHKRDVALGFDGGPGRTRPGSCAC